MEDTTFQRMESLLDYLGEVIKLGRKVIRDVKNHDDLLLYQRDIPETEGISLFSKNEEELSWLTIYQQIVPSPPLLPDILNNWVNVYEDPSKEPEMVEIRSIPSTTDDSGEKQTVSFSDDEERVAAAEQIGDVIFYKSLQASRDGIEMMKKGIKPVFGKTSY